MGDVFRMALSEFRSTFFIGKHRPCMNTLKKWIEAGELAGEKIGNLYFVLVDHNGEPIKSDTGNQAANDMLHKWLKHGSQAA